MSEKIKKYEFRLTTPPSINTSYKAGYNQRTGKTVFYMDKRSHDAKNILIKEIRAYASINGCPKFKEKVVIGEVIPVNFRKGRDIDNIKKMLFDALEISEIIDNDSNIIPRTLYKKYTDEKECYIILKLYESKGSPSLEDIKEYFFWHDKNSDILGKMMKKISKKREKKNA